MRQLREADVRLPLHASSCPFSQYFGSKGRAIIWRTSWPGSTPLNSTIDPIHQLHTNVEIVEKKSRSFFWGGDARVELSSKSSHYQRLKVFTGLTPCLPHLSMLEGLFIDAPGGWRTVRCNAASHRSPDSDFSMEQEFLLKQRFSVGRKNGQFQEVKLMNAFRPPPSAL